MGIRSGLRRMLGRERNSVLDGPGTFSRLHRIFAEPDSLANPHQFDVLAREGYRYGAVVSSCVVEKATSIAEPELVIEERRGGRWERVELGAGRDGSARQLLRLLNDPRAGRTTQYEFLELMLTHYEVYGNCFIRKRRRGGTGPPGALEILPVPRLELVRGEDGFPSAVKVHPFLDRSLVPKEAGSIPTVPIDDFIHIKYPDPIDDFWGLPPMVRVLREVDLDSKSIDYVRAFFKNAGKPEGILKSKGIIPADARRSIQDQWRERYSGEGGWWNVAVLDQDFEYQETGTRPDKLKLDHVWDATESRICSAYGVPPVIIAVRIGLMKSTYTNYESAVRSFWKETLRPLYIKLGQALTLGLASEFGDDLRIAFCLDHIDELQQSMQAKQQFAREAYDSGLLTRNEARALLGYADDVGGDHYKTKSSDGVPAKPDEVPLGNPKLKQLDTPAASAGKPAVGSSRQGDSAGAGGKLIRMGGE